jgi:hypothetical protein
MNFWSDTEAVYKAGVVTLFMKDIFDLSSLCPQQCLVNHIPDSEGQEGQEPTTPTKTVGPSREEASSSKKVPISNRFNPDLLHVRPNRRKSNVITQVKGLGHSDDKHRVKVSD